MLNKEQIKEIIPQREPFLMIDEVEEYIPGESAVAYKYVNEEEWYFKGHFPGNPIMPGVLITESLAQAGAIAILSMKENKGKNALFGGIDKMKFKKMVVPGDKLKLEVKIVKRKGPIGIGEAIAYAKEQAEEMKTQFTAMFDELDKLIQEKYAELEQVAVDEQSRNEELEKNRSVLNWIEECQKQVNEAIDF